MGKFSNDTFQPDWGVWSRFQITLLQSSFIFLFPICNFYDYPCNEMWKNKMFYFSHLNYFIITLIGSFWKSSFQAQCCWGIKEWLLKLRLEEITKSIRPSVTFYAWENCILVNNSFSLKDNCWLVCIIRWNCQNLSSPLAPTKFSLERK